MGCSTLTFLVLTVAPEVIMTMAKCVSSIEMISYFDMVTDDAFGLMAIPV